MSARSDQKHTATLDTLAWPSQRVAEALACLAQSAGLPVKPGVLTPPAGMDASHDAVARWIEHASARLGIDTEAVGAFYPDLENLVRGAAPALVAIGSGRFLALAGVERNTARLIAPDGGIHRARFADLWNRLVAGIPGADDDEVEALLDRANVPERRRARVRESLRRTRLSQQWVEGWWMLRLSPSATLGDLVKHSRLGRRLFGIVAAHVALCAIGLGAWSLIGRGALDGRLDRGWLLAWGLLICTQVVLQVLVSRAEGNLAVEAGGLLKQRLLSGALALPPEHVRRNGAGQLLGTVIESEAIESLAVSGGFASAVAVVQLLAAAAVLAFGTSAGWELASLAMWLVLTGVLVHRYWRARRRWTDERIAMTHDLVEKMVGHRTRLAQERRTSRHAGEDEAVARSLDASERMDRQATLLSALVPQGWLVAGIAAMAPAFIAARTSGTSLAGVAISVGGVLLAYRALRKLTLGLTSLAGAHIAWERVRPLVETGSEDVEVGPLLVLERTDASTRAPILDAREVAFSYPRRADPVVRGCNLTLRQGDRILLEGASGGGKSTLSALLAGLREPSSGVLLLGGLDRRSLGLDGWRRRVALAPQFHENHVLTGTFAFNLLMGRRWPPRREDVAEAQAICEELGLGPLLARMPSGIEQMVGETGWQLSQGEKSRLFLARALLQDADVLILDESFAALDPHTTRAAFSCVLQRAKTLLVVAHP